MARFIPDVESDQIQHDSERLVYDALRGLPDGYVVLHSYPWLRPKRDLANEPLNEGEADFVILHRKKGILVLEVKGGEPRLDEMSRTWVRSGKPMRDPFEQARRNRYALLDALEERTQRRIRRENLTHGDVVVFPHCRYDGPLPLHTDERILLDQSSLASLPEEIENAWDAWERKPADLSEEHFQDLLRSLMPKLRLVRYIASDIATEKERILQITRDQQATLQGLLSNDRVLVEGTAGSGKTLLAMEFLKSLCEQGRKALFLCFNKNLADWVREVVTGDPRVVGAPAQPTIAHFHSFAMKLATRAGVEFEIPKEKKNDFWDDDAPMILVQAIEVLRARGEEVEFEAVIVDEGQDFARDWWATIEEVIAGGNRGRLYVFMDLKQSLRGETKTPPVDFSVKFPLLTNCRNTRSIAETGSKLNDSDVNVLPSSPQGSIPTQLRAASEAALPGLVMGEIRKLWRVGVESRQIAVIGPTGFDKSPIARNGSIDGVNFVQSAREWRRGDGILVTNARAFKGLEADVVLVHSPHSFSSTFTTTDLYVAWTRACSRLIIVTIGDNVRSVVEGVLGTLHENGDLNASTSQTPI